MSHDDRQRIIDALRPAEPWPHAPSPEVIADALVPVVQELLAAERRRAAEDGQRLRERVEALAAERHPEGVWVLRAKLRAALRDDTGDGRSETTDTEGNVDAS